MLLMLTQSNNFSIKNPQPIRENPRKHYCPLNSARAGDPVRARQLHRATGAAPTHHL